MFDKSQMSESFDVPAGCIGNKVEIARKHNSIDILLMVMK